MCKVDPSEEPAVISAGDASSSAAPEAEYTTFLTLIVKCSRIRLESVDPVADSLTMRRTAVERISSPCGMSSPEYQIMLSHCRMGPAKKACLTSCIKLYTLSIVVVIISSIIRETLELHSYHAIGPHRAPDAVSQSHYHPSRYAYAEASL